MSTIREVLLQASSKINRFEARLLLGHVLKCRKEYFITHDNEHVADSHLSEYLTLVERRLQGEPIPYIIGSQEFFSRSFYVAPGVLIPRPDTETLIETVIEQTRHFPAKTLLDLGTGSGCIAVTLALELPYLRVSASDLSPQALSIASDNARRLGADVSFYQGAWFDAVDEEMRFDIIASNPPYIHPEDSHLRQLRYEPIGALTDGVDGLEDLRQIVKGAPAHLNAGGLLILEHGFDQGDSVRELFDPLIWTLPQTIKDLGDNDRVTFARLHI